MKNPRSGKLVAAGGAAFLLLLTVKPPIPSTQNHGIAEQFRQLTAATEWQPAGTISIPFDTFHPQGMTIVGEHIFFSSVEVTVSTEEFERPADGYDRTAGKGVGHLFKVDHSGNLLASITLGEDSIYHPGGIDFDGAFIWVPVAEYRPNSRSIVYRVDPSTMEATEVFRFNDHLGALVFEPTDSTLHGVSWGSRFFYTWRLSGGLELTDDGRRLAERRVPNGNHYVDYQDCLYVDIAQMLCSGVKSHDVRAVGDSMSLEFTLGGLDLIDLQSKRAVHQIPFNLRVADGRAMSTNPFFAELKDDHLRFFFMPEDNQSTIYVFDAIRNELTQCQCG